MVVENKFSLLIFCLVILITLLACSEEEEFVFEGTVSIEAYDSSLVIFNQTNATIYYWAVEREAMNSFDWRPCDDPDKCSDIAIKPGDSKEIPQASIAGWKPGAEVLVHLWYLVRSSSSDSGYQVEGLPLQTVDIPLE